MRRALTLAALALAAGCSTDEPLDGALLASEKGCVACHGSDGKATAPIYPNLNGQWERYLRVQLLRYKDGSRSNAIMNGFASTLGDDEIRALAADWTEVIDARGNSVIPGLIDTHNHLYEHTLDFPWVIRSIPEMNYHLAETGGAEEEIFRQLDSDTQLDFLEAPLSEVVENCAQQVRILAR